MLISKVQKRGEDRQFLLYIAVLFGIFTASVLKVQSIFILGLLGISLLCLHSSPVNFLFLFSLFIPTNDIFPKEQFLFEAIGIKQILGGTLITFYLLSKRKIDGDFSRTVFFQHNRRLIRLLFKLTYLFILYWCFTYYKNAYFSMHSFTYATATMKSVNSIIFLFSLIPFTKLLISYMSEKQIIKSITFCIYNMFIFTVLSPYLPTLGFRALGTETTEFSDVQSYERYVGVIADGDSNTLGVFFAISVSFLLIFYHKLSKRNFILLLGCSMLAILLTGSRTAFISACFCILIFFFFIKPDKGNKAKQVMIVFIPVFLVLALPFLQMVIDRLTLANEQLDTDTEANRIGKWIIYFDFFTRNPETFLGGAVKELRISWDDHYYAAHNVFISMIYNAGILFPGILLHIIFLLYKKIGNRTSNKDYILILLPFSALMFTVSDLGIFYGFILFSVCYVRLKTGLVLTVVGKDDVADIISSNNTRN